MKSSTYKTISSSEAKQQEEEDLAKAIQLSIKENFSKQTQQQKNSLYGSVNLSNSHNSTQTKKSRSNADLNSEKMKVKALYDFEAVEENEITFKAGDILIVIDSRDQNWWKGLNQNGDEGLFPSNFVTSDLSIIIENYDTNSVNKKVTFNEAVEVQNLKNDFKTDENKNIILIDEKKIDKCIELLQNADPTGEIQSDSPGMLDLEDKCYMMGPLIDQQLQKIDLKHAILEDLNFKILEAFQMYNNLMKESINKSNLMGSIQGNSSSNLNFLNSQNSISLVAAPPQSENSGMLLANNLNNFIPPNINSNLNPLISTPLQNNQFLGISSNNYNSNINSFNQNVHKETFQKYPNTNIQNTQLTNQNILALKNGLMSMNLSDQNAQYSVPSMNNASSDLSLNSNNNQVTDQYGQNI